MKPIIIFDLGGVLINLNVPRCIQAFSDLIGEENVRNIMGMNKDGEGIEAVSIATRQLMRDFERGLVTTDEFIAAILQYAPSGTTSDQIREAWFAMLEDLPQERLDYLAQLRKQGYRLYLLSNGNDLHWTYIDKLYHVSSYFEQVFLSQVMHCAKPDISILILLASRSTPRRAVRLPFPTMAVHLGSFGTVSISCSLRVARQHTVMLT